LLRALVTLVIFTTIFRLLPIGEVWQAMIRIGWWTWLVVLGVFGVGHVVAAYKWCRLVRAAGQQLAFGDALGAHMTGLFANIWLPSIVGGDVLRAGWISGQQGITIPAVVGMLDRVLDLLALLLLVALGTLFVGDMGGGLAISVLRCAGILLMVGLAGGLVMLRWLRPEHLPAAVRPHGLMLIDIGKALYARPGPALASFTLALLVQSVFVALNWYLGTAMGIIVPFAVWLVAWPLAKIIALLPVSLGGLGVREASLATLLAPFAVTGTLAVAEGLVWQSILFAFGLLAGMGTLLSGRRPGQRGR
jgi:uncharacterized membrane protein YbhN (UPF0104 family)